MKLTVQASESTGPLTKKPGKEKMYEFFFFSQVTEASGFMAAS
jgi:hypothetical protein